jgi:phenylalanyl-tRNA synthetase beta chain
VAGERLTLLNEQTVELDANIGVVADDNGPEAIAGIMGGLSTSVTLDTTDVYLEAAFWWPESIQGRPRRSEFRPPKRRTGSSAASISPARRPPSNG